MTLELKPFDAAEYLDNDEAIAAYLDSALDGNDTDFTAALGVVARAKGMTEVARQTGLTRPALYRSLSDLGRPEFATVQHVLRSLGMRLHVAPDREISGLIDAPSPSTQGAQHGLLDVNSMGLDQMDRRYLSTIATSFGSRRRRSLWRSLGLFAEGDQGS